MALRRCVGHAINVPSFFPINLTFDVGTGTSASACLTYSITTLAKSSWSDTLWIAKDITNTFPIATSQGGSLTNNLHRYEISVFMSSFSSSTTQLPLSLALPHVGSTTPSYRGMCCCEVPMNSSYYSNSCLTSSLICDFNSSLNWSLNSSLIQASCSIMTGFWDELEWGADPIYYLIPTPNPTVRTLPGCSSVPIVFVNISCLPRVTKHS